jgi:uncharacterized OsmC-like protein
MEKARVVTQEGYQTTITNGRHEWHADVGEAAGGVDSSPNPEEILLGALGSCTVQTLHMYANRKGWDLQRVEIDLEFHKLRAEEVEDYDGEAKFVHRIHKDIRLIGNLDEKQRARLMEIGEKCPVHRILLGPTLLSQTNVTANLPEEA